MDAADDRERQDEIFRLDRLDTMVRELGPVRPLRTLREIRWLVGQLRSAMDRVDHLETLVNQYDERCTRMRVQLEDRNGDAFQEGVRMMSVARESLEQMKHTLMQIRDVTAPDNYDPRGWARSCLEAVLANPMEGSRPQ